MPDLYIKWDSGFRIDADADGDETLWRVKQALPKALLANYLCLGGTYDLTPADTNLQLNQGDITAIRFVYLEADFDAMGYRLIGGAGNTVLGKPITDSPAISMLMTNSTSIFVSAGGTTGGRLKYLLAGT
jgi:hypothetical protein